MIHSVPYMMACTCMAWLGSKVSEPVPSYSMFDRPALKGRITLLDDMREVLGAALRSLGFPLNSPKPAMSPAAGKATSRNSTANNTKAASRPASSTSSRATPATCCKWPRKTKTSS
jgi:spermidine/putrescine-binding protein